MSGRCEQIRRTVRKQRQEKKEEEVVEQQEEEENGETLVFGKEGLLFLETII